MRAGIAFRPGLATWLATRPADVRCLEFTVDDALTAHRASRAGRISRCPAALHASQVSVLAPAASDPGHVERLLRAVRALAPIWISIYLGWRHRPEAELSYPQSLTLSGATLRRAIERCRRLIDAGVRPLLVENVATFGVGAGAMSPARFINQLCEESGCGFLVDVTALALDERFGFDPRRWLWDVDPSHVTALHIGGWAAQGGGRWAGRHDGQVPFGAWTLASEVADRTPVGTAILQRDGRCASIAAVQEDLRRLAGLDRVGLPSLTRPEPAVATR